VRTRAKILHLLASVDVNGHNVCLGVAVLARLGGRDLHTLARMSLDHQVGALPDLSCLLRIGVGSS